MDKPVSLFTRILIVIIGFGFIAGFIFIMQTFEKRITSEFELRQLEVKNRNLSIQKQTRITMTEVMSSNSLTIQDGFGLSSDWIEFYNSGDEVINLRGAGLSTDIDDPMMWEFPDFEIGPKDYKIVYASGLNVVDSAGIPHLNFKLNAELGETLYFTSALGTLISTIVLPPMGSDISYGINDKGEWLYFNHPTPIKENGNDGQGTADFKVYIDSPLLITEYMMDNRSVLYDEDGDYVDWIELFNKSYEPFPLAGLYFSDDVSDLRKWQFPDIVIKPGSYLVVYASAKDKQTNNIHTNFRLSEFETLVISTQYSEVLVELTLDHLLEDISRGVKDGKWVFFSEPTPGKENSTHGFPEIPEPSGKVWDVSINEVMARNTSFLADENDHYYDWIELKNNTDHDINLQGYSISNDAEQMEYYFLDYVLPARDFAVFFADKEAETNGTGNYLPFSISASGETLYLCDVNCDGPQSFETGFLGENMSSGLSEKSERVFFQNPTPWETNSANYFASYAAPVEFSLNGGEITSGQQLLLTAEKGAEIFFTLDGSLPAPSDTLYVNPILLDASKTVRAIAIVDGKLPSQIVTHTYIVDVVHDLPIIAMSTEPDHLFGYEGIYSRSYQDIEIPVHVEFYEIDGWLALDFDAGVEIFGGTSQMEPQKSFAFHLRKDYGTEEINYPLFVDNEVISFNHFLLRTSGQDTYMTKIRDAFIHKAVKDVIDIEVMDSRPCVVYINGEYWGLYNIREKVNEDYLASHHGVDPNQVDLLVWNGKTMAGKNEAYLALVQYVATHDMQQQAYYEYVASIVDIDNLIDYLVIQCYFGNTDSGNIKYWRDQNGGKWRWILYDMDWALFMGTYQWNNISQVFNPEGMGFSDWIDTTLHVNLLKNEQFREEFIKRYALYTRTHFNPERLLPIYDAMIAAIKNEMPRQLARWPKPSGSVPWEEHVAITRQIIIEKPEIEKRNLQFFFSLDNEEMQQLFP